MCRSDHIQHVLEILARNAKDSVNPGLMASVAIADKLNLSLTETKQILLSMNKKGFIECNMEVDYSLITQQGVRKLNC